MLAAQLRQAQRCRTQGSGTDWGLACATLIEAGYSLLSWSSVLITLASAHTMLVSTSRYKRTWHPWAMHHSRREVRRQRQTRHLPSRPWRCASTVRPTRAVCRPRRTQSPQSLPQRWALSRPPEPPGQTCGTRVPCSSAALMRKSAGCPASWSAPYLHDHSFSAITASLFALITICTPTGMKDA